MTDPLSLADLETLREGWDFEAKLAAGKDGKGAIPKSFWQTYSGMANTEGGAILRHIHPHPRRRSQSLPRASPAHAP